MLLFALSINLICISFSEVPHPQDDLQGLTITKIEIKTRRVDPETIRKLLPVKEGEIYKTGDLDIIRQRLFAMRFFKKIDLSAEKDPSQGGVSIRLNLEDGWYLIPLPFFISGGGGPNGFLALAERNVFKRSEVVLLSGGGNKDGGFGSLGFDLHGLNLSAFYSNRDSTEWAYSDGGYNTDGRFRSSRSESDPGKYGVIQSQYDRRTEGGRLQTRFPLTPSSKAILGFGSEKITYSNLVTGVLPSDQGNLISITNGISFTTRNTANGIPDTGFSLQEFGAVLGYGMADLSERIKPLPRIVKVSELELSATESGSLLGSDFNFVKPSLTAQTSLMSRSRKRIALRVKGRSGASENLPLTQKVATNRVDLGLRGNYAREFRGDRGAGATLDFSFPFHRTVWGSWTTDIFADFAAVWDSGVTYSKQGVGFGITYQFWRFPLPLGFIYSYSIDDHDSQNNIAFGGRF